MSELFLTHHDRHQTAVVDFVLLAHVLSRKPRLERRAKPKNHLCRHLLRQLDVDNLNNKKMLSLLTRCRAE
jgi:hypothetical protein